ncbi:Bgt-51322, partial [Blumeria graminis f. sp. tritici]
LSVSLSQISNTLPQFPYCGCSSVNPIQVTSVPLSHFPLQETPHYYIPYKDFYSRAYYVTALSSHHQAPLGFLSTLL